MIRSLRARLILLTIVVTGTALVATAQFSRLAVKHEFRRLETSTRQHDLSQAAASITDRIRQVGNSAASDSLLAQLADHGGEELILVDDADHVIAASMPELRTAQFRRGGDGTIDVVVQSRRGHAWVLKKASFSGQTGVAVKAGDDKMLGRLFPFPREDARETARDSGFLWAVNRWLLVALLGSGALAALLAMTLSRRILGPIEELTRAVRKMEAGELGHRVTTRSRDEIGELARAFNAMAESVARNDALRRGLVSDVAHELRTPLTNLRGQIEAIQDGLITPDTAAVRSLHEEVQLLARLVDDLQELALAEAGQLPLHRDAVAVAPAIAAALDAVSAAARAAQVSLRAKVSANSGDVNADPGRLAQILRNLLANALTHTPPGGHVIVSAIKQNGGVAIAVEDNGAGIEPQHLPHVFDRFYRADPSRARASGSAGLGLAIVRQLVEAHGGTVTAESRLGEGARFTIVLPSAHSS